MSKQTIKIQGDYDTYVFKCYCGESSYLEIMQDSDDSEIYITITKHPTRLKERLTDAWKALRGLEFSASNSIVLLDDDIPKLIDALDMTAKPITNNEDELGEKISSTLQEHLVLANDNGQPYIQYDDIAIRQIQELINKRILEAKIEELKDIPIGTNLEAVRLWVDGRATHLIRQKELTKEK